MDGTDDEYRNTRVNRTEESIQKLGRILLKHIPYDQGQSVEHKNTGVSLNV